ncbi:uncharacterized protein LOC110108940 [Dendrobium catenatum]|uniref:Uncharacterized protein n=1 Tax=Dendrobium catenatum TaxID=906689 RepID=A0A2I0VF29_9ASPA|nr:uncharacterized protein LOC110108940 [Dendrobium catenatum]PKU62027.1 hypothetical protein MA16_Dca012136 [Dendrobium catenatum]
MQNIGDLIAPALLNDIDGNDEKEEVILDDDSIAAWEGFIESKSMAELISPEDLEWVDSCLVAEPELSMESWASLKEALIDSVTAFTDSYEVNNADDLDESGNGEKMEVDKEMVLGKPEIANDQGDSAHVGARMNCTGGDDRNDRDEGIQKEIESPESIFRVWDLQEEQEGKEHELIPELTRAVSDLQVAKEREDEFLTELKQAVAESILRDKQREAIGAAITAEDGKLDDIISSMGDLSL